MPQAASDRGPLHPARSHPVAGICTVLHPGPAHQPGTDDRGGTEQQQGPVVSGFSPIVERCHPRARDRCGEGNVVLRQELCPESQELWALPLTVTQWPEGLGQVPLLSWL